MTKEELIPILKQRFKENMKRHEGISWDIVEEKLQKENKKTEVILNMENTGGEPDVIGVDEKTGMIIFCDCVKETPEGRRNTCYDEKSEEARKKKGIFPNGNVISMAADIGIELLDEEWYRKLQDLGDFDTKTSSWIKTPEDILKLGGAIFADYRYGHVFIYHNSAPSFYSNRGFRGLLRV